ncbi:MAG: hypothetical protein ACRCYT_01060 [Cetobacterium sp.]
MLLLGLGLLVVGTVTKVINDKRTVNNAISKLRAEKSRCKSGFEHTTFNDTIEDLKSSRLGYFQKLNSAKTILNRATTR